MLITVVPAVHRSPLGSGGCQFGLPGCEDGFGTPFQFVVWGDVADGTVQPCVVVVLDVSVEDLAGIVEAQRSLAADAFEPCHRSILPLLSG